MRKLAAIFMTCLLCIGLAGTQAKADIIDYTYRGNFTYHNDVIHFNFSMAADGEVTFFSSSWVNGGFDPILAVWDVDGSKLSQQDDGGRSGTQMVNGVEYEHGQWDSYFSQPLAAGDYTVTVATYQNWAISDLLTDGFDYDDQQGILIEEWSQPANGYRTSFFEFHILGVTSVEVIPPQPSPTPEPSTILLLGIGLGGLYLMRRREKR